MSDISTCPICNSSQVRPFLDLSEQPIYCNLLWPNYSQAKACPKGEIQLLLCLDCGFIYNQKFDSSLLDYSQSYENSLHYSPRFQAYADGLAQKLVENHQLYEKTILEIGCGKGDFLQSLCSLGNNSGIGFDSSYVPQSEHDHLDITFIQDYYSEKYAHYQADFICCRQVLEHLQQPSALLTRLHTVAQESGASLFFEVPNTTYILRDLAIWDIIYEHCNYFTDISLNYIFKSNGFKVIAVTEEFGGQFLGIEVTPMSEVQTSNDRSDIDDLLCLVSSFKKRFEEKTTVYRDYLCKWKQTSRKVAVWGSGSKGVTFLNLLDADESLVTCAVDINPKKQGKFIAGTGQCIVPPSSLCDRSIDVILIMNPLYTQEIKASLAEMGLNPELVIV